MLYNGKHYYKIDVPGIKDGYSFMAVSSDELDELDVLDLCCREGYFDDDTDARYAEVDDLVSVYDIEHFIKNGCVREI